MLFVFVSTQPRRLASAITSSTPENNLAADDQGALLMEMKSTAYGDLAKSALAMSLVAVSS
jgi:hypothetical protein